jgi:hypothetical protein
MNVIPTSNFEDFQKQLLNPNVEFKNTNQEIPVQKIQKNLVLSFMSDNSGCGHIRNIFPMTYLNAIFGKTGRFNMILSPVMIYQHDIMARSRSLFFQRTMDPRQIPIVKQYKELQKRYKYKMIYEIDDFVWKGDREGEEIPQYNFGRTNITDDVQKASIEIMNMMDTVCVTTEFLKDYIIKKGVVNPEIKILPNAVAQYFWGTQRKPKIKEAIKKPKVLWTGSPTHYHNQLKLLGDMETVWKDWIIKNVIDNKIEYYQMGGLPWFFEEIKDKIKIIPWVNSYTYHLPIKEIQPDISIGTLVPNFFNYSKSDLKAIESYAYEAIFIGSNWKGTKYQEYPSPYDNCIVQLPYDASYKELDDLIWSSMEPEKYNNIIEQQYKILTKDNRWLESPNYVKLWTDIL